MQANCVTPVSYSVLDQNCWLISWYRSKFSPVLGYQIVDLNQNLKRPPSKKTSALYGLKNVKQSENCNFI